MKRDYAYPEFADPMVRPRYLGIATFMRAPLIEDLSSVDIGLAGIPFDGGVTNRPGARHGPREIRNQSSLMRKVNQASGINPYALCRVGDVGDAWVEKPYELTGALNARRSWEALAAPAAAIRAGITYRIRHTRVDTGLPGNPNTD